MKKYLLLLLSGWCFHSHSQQIRIDQAISVEGLWCFPINGKPDAYRYLPNKATLAENQQRLPEFSFIRYVAENKTSGNLFNAISEAYGGGILHFLALYQTSIQDIDKAQRKLRTAKNNENIIIEGPILFEKGTFRLVSSILQTDNSEKQTVLKTGNAPLLENSKIALSFELNQLKSKLLLESFKMATPDVSLIFDLGFSGLTDSYEAEIEVNWDEINKKEFTKTEANFYFIGADIEKNIDSLVQNKAIKLTVKGNNPNLEALMKTVYEKVTDMLFRKIESSGIPADKKEDLEQKGLASLLNMEKITGLGVNSIYQSRTIKNTGTTKIIISGQTTTERHHLLTFNIGDLYKQYGQNQAIFKDVSLNDPAFMQREIRLGIDGRLEKEFDKMVNGVTIKLRKKHQDGSETIKEALITHKTFQENLGKFSMIYLNNKDTDTEKWLQYDYQTHWQFIDGNNLNNEWTSQSNAMITLDVPYKRQAVQFFADWEIVKQAGIRAITVKINYPFFEQTRSEQITIRTGEKLDDKKIEITLPQGTTVLNYEIIWYKNNGERLTAQIKDSTDLIFLDNIPQK